MKLQYLGDSRDAFKWDILHWICANSSPCFGELVYVPMLTPDIRNSPQGKTSPLKFDCSNFISKFVSSLRKKPRSLERVKSLGATEQGASPFRVSLFSPYEFIGSGKQRARYWDGFKPEQFENAVVFFDPDNGFETVTCDGTKWVRHSELEDFLSRLPDTSVAVVYQHRPMRKWVEVFADLTVRMGYAHTAIAAYEGNLAFVALANNASAGSRVRAVIENYANAPRKHPNVRVAVLRDALSLTHKWATPSPPSPLPKGAREELKLQPKVSVLTNITTTPAWRVLAAHAETLRGRHLRQMFAADPGRTARLKLEQDGILADFSRQRLTPETMTLLHALAREAEMSGWIARLFSGERINLSENRAALHMALRGAEGDVFCIDGRNVMPQVLAERARLRAFCANVHESRWRGYTDESITDVVNIGIGGSDLGPRMAVQALAAAAKPGLRLHFVSNIDAADLAMTLRGLDPARTLFIVASKTFTTQETLANAHSAKQWLLRAGVLNMGQTMFKLCYGAEFAPEMFSDSLEETQNKIVARHFAAISTNVSAAKEFGIPETNVFPFWDWVGGRYSPWSAIGLPLALAIGMDNFEQLLAGARAMDRHFREAPPETNLPLTLALLDLWNTDFLGAETRAVLPYSRSLALLPPYLQQLEMESNGKAIDRNGRKLACASAPIVWGGPGSDTQHSFFQLLHQGGRLVPCEFIAMARPDFDLPGHHDKLLANCFAQSETLAYGRNTEEARADLAAAGRAENDIAALLPHKVFPGNQPSTTLLLPRLDATTLGMLLALYEHKVFALGVLWGLNSFDQWGVELGKQLAARLLPIIEGNNTTTATDPTTRQLIDYIRKRD